MSWLFSDTEEAPRGSYVGGLVAIVLVLALVWAGWALFSSLGDDGPASATDGSPGDAKGVLGAPAAAGSATPCRDVYRLQSPVLSSAAASMAGWRAHVDTMDQYADGEISLAQAEAFWHSTHDQAADLLAQYDEARATYAARTTRCPGTAAASSGSAGSGAPACVAAVAARNEAMRAARIALTTWRTHVHYMDMLRDGTMSPDTAKRLWKRSGDAGAAEIETYDHATSAARDGTC